MATTEDEKRNGDLIDRAAQTLHDHFGREFLGARLANSVRMAALLARELHLSDEEVSELLGRLESEGVVTWIEESVADSAQLPEESSEPHWRIELRPQDRARAAPESTPTPTSEEELGATRRVIVFAAPNDPRELRDLLVRELGLHPTDAMVRAHSAPCVLPDPLAPERADRLVAALAELGLVAETLPTRDVPDFHHGEAVHHAKCLAEGFEILEMHDREEELVPWEEIALISVGQVPSEVAHRYAEPATVVAARWSIARASTISLPAGPEAWIVRANPRKAFRIDHGRMNYEALGDRKTDSATHNFRVFLGDLVGHAPNAHLPPATRAFLEHGPVRHYEFPSSRELLHYTVFHLLMRERIDRHRETTT